jgi:hypothetical protein
MPILFPTIKDGNDFCLTLKLILLIKG